MALDSDFMLRLAESRGDSSRFSQLVFGSALHDGQIRYCQNANAQVNFLLPGNSFGKTELILRRAFELAWWKESDYTPTDFEEWLQHSYRILIASYSYPIAKESFSRLRNAYNSREELRALVSAKYESDPPHIILSNGSRIDWGSLDGQGRLVEAARYQHIFVDEAGHIPDLSQTFDSILFPRTMGVGGRVHLFGTPKPESDPYLLEVYEKGRPGANKDPFYHSQPGSCLENEFWPKAERDRVLSNPRYVTGWYTCDGCDDILHIDGRHPQLTQMGKQVILGEFILAGGFLFSRPHVVRMFAADTEHNVRWIGDRYFYSKPDPGHLYLGAFDLGGNKLRKRKKKGSDPTVGMVIDFTTRPWKVVWFRYIEGGEMDWHQKYEVMADVFKEYGMPYLLIDSTGTVDSVQEALQDRGVEIEGVQFGGSGGRKLDMLRNLQLCLELEWGESKGVLRSPLIPKLKDELDRYILPDDDIEQDCVMTLAMLAHHIAQTELPAAVSGDVY